MRRTTECEKCGHIQPIKKTNLKQAIEYPDIIKQISDYKSLPVYVGLKHQGFWTTNINGIHVPNLDESCNRNSVMLYSDCLLYVHKIALRHLLLSMHIIQPSEIDPANLVPHVVVRKNKDDPFSKYKSIQDENFLISEADISSKLDFIMVELDKKRDLHMTLIYSKGIGKKINLIEAFTNVIKLLNFKPELIELYSSLKYFGNNEIEYWYDTGSLYPNNISIPENYIKEIKEPKKINVTSAGSVI
jgi:hypothetical protein